MPEIKQFRAIMTEVTAQATGHKEIMFFFSDNSFAARLIEVIFHSYLPSIHNISLIFTKHPHIYQV